LRLSKIASNIFNYFYKLMYQLQVYNWLFYGRHLKESLIYLFLLYKYKACYSAKLFLLMHKIIIYFNKKVPIKGLFCKLWRLRQRLAAQYLIL